jgi:hypothetical protein
LIKSKGVAPRKANLLANFIMLTAASNKRITNRAPSDYLKDVKAALGNRLSEVLAANLLSPAAFDAALADDYNAFLVERSTTIDQAVSQLTGW